MVKLFLDPNLKLSQFISCVVHTLHSVQEYRCTSLLGPVVTQTACLQTCGPQQKLWYSAIWRGWEGAALEGKCYLLGNNSNWYNVFLYHSFQSDMFLPNSCEIYVRFGINQTLTKKYFFFVFITNFFFLFEEEIK